jgi:hypothetical protein
VLLPGMPLAVRIFEDRYVALLRDVLADETREFGVVLIERGQEVGGGESRFGFGTIARIGDLYRAAHWMQVLARGTERFEVEQWLPDDPYPRAEVRILPQASWTDTDGALLERANRIVRRGLAQASEFGDTQWNPAVKLPGEGVELAWRLAGIAPIGPLDHLDLLGSATASELLNRLIAHVEALEETWVATALGDAPEA